MVLHSASRMRGMSVGMSSTGGDEGCKQRVVVCFVHCVFVQLGRGGDMQPTSAFRSFQCVDTGAGYMRVRMWHMSHVMPVAHRIFASHIATYVRAQVVACVCSHMRRTANAVLCGPTFAQRFISRLCMRPNSRLCVCEMRGEKNGQDDVPHVFVTPLRETVCKRE